MRIGQFSKTANTSIDTIRYYIKEGLLLPKKSGTYWDFEDDDVEILSNITSLKKLDFSLLDIKYIITSSTIIVEKGKINQKELVLFQNFIEEKISSLENKVKEIHAAKQKLQNMSSKLNTLKDKEYFNKWNGYQYWFLHYFTW